MQIFSYEDIISTDIPPKEHVKTGTKLDDLCNGGFVKGEVHLFCGSSGQGKSLSLLHLALNCAIEGNSVIYIVFENSYEEDFERIKDAHNIYKDYINDNLYNNFIYYNDSEERGNTKEKLETILSNLEENDIVFVDGTEFLISGSSPTEISSNGRTIMSTLVVSVRKTNSTLVMSWQTNRLAGGKKIEELGIEDLSGSMSMPQQASSVWLVRQWREKTFNWKIRRIKCRGKVEQKNDTINVLNEKEEFNLR